MTMEPELTDTAVDTTGSGLIEPTEPGTSARYLPGKHNRRYLTWYALTTVAITGVWTGVSGIVLPNHIQLIEIAQFFTGVNAHVDLQALETLRQGVEAGRIHPTAAQRKLLAILGDYSQARATASTVIASVGVILTMIAQPIVGFVSDRTRSKWGRRAPWILFGALVGSGALALMPYAPGIVGIGIIFTFAQVLLNVCTGPLGATVADRVTEERRGRVSAINGLAAFVSGVGSSIFAGFAFGAIGLGVYQVFAVFIVFCTVMFVLIARDRSSRDLVVPKIGLGETLAAFTIALRSHDFRWVFIARMLLTMGFAVSTALGFFMLQGYIQPALTQQQATQLSPLISLAAVPFTILAIVVSGRISDRIQKRKPFVITASVLLAVAMGIMFFSPTLPAFFIMTILGGAAFGIYLPVDQALFLDVLPDKSSAGRDLGVAGLGGNLGTAVGPLLANATFALAGGYQWVWAVGFVILVGSGLAILPVRKVR